MGDMRFTTTVESRPRGGVSIALPADPDATWGAKDRHYVAGSIQGYGVRGVVTSVGGRHVLQLGPSWCRDPRVGPGAEVSVVLRPEGPQLDSMSPDVAAALRSEPVARRFFESLATFYRNGFVDWIEAAKRPETRAGRIEATLEALKAGRRER